MNVFTIAAQNNYMCPITVRLVDFAYFILSLYVIFPFLVYFTVIFKNVKGNI